MVPIREAKEEAGVDIQPKDMELVHVHCSPSEGEGTERANFYLVAHKWDGEPHNAETDKASEVGWFALDELPDKMIEHFKSAVLHVFDGNYYSEHGYDA